MAGSARLGTGKSRMQGSAVLMDFSLKPPCILDICQKAQFSTSYAGVNFSVVDELCYSTSVWIAGAR